MRRRGERTAADPIGRREWWAWGVLVALAVAARFIDLASRPYQFDEGQVAYAAYGLSEHGDYHYMPVLHGPLNYELTALSHLVFGQVDVANRIPAAIAGSILVALAFGLRRQLGPLAAFAGGVLLCFSPTLLYYSRFSREELVMAAVTLASGRRRRAARCKPSPLARRGARRPARPELRDEGSDVPARPDRDRGGVCVVAPARSGAHARQGARALAALRRRGLRARVRDPVRSVRHAPLRRLGRRLRRAALLGPGARPAPRRRGLVRVPHPARRLRAAAARARRCRRGVVGPPAPRARHRHDGRGSAHARDLLLRRRALRLAARDHADPARAPRRSRVRCALAFASASPPSS